MAKVETEKRKGRIWQLGKEDLSLEDARQLKRHIINVDKKQAKLTHKPTGYQVWFTQEYIAIQFLYTFHIVLTGKAMK